MALLVRGSGRVPGLIPGCVGCNWLVCDPPGLRGGLCLSFLCSKAIIVVFRIGTGIYTGLDGVDGAWHFCIGAQVVLGYRYRYSHWVLVSPLWVVAPPPV